MYRVIIERRVSKEIENLPDELLQQVIDTIGRLKHNPRPYNVKKLVNRDGWRIRIGDYRVLYTIDDDKKLVAIYRVKHRREAYR